MIDISAAEARRLRMRAQLLGGSTLSPAEVVRRAGALQGQDLAAVQRAIALRSAAGTTTEAVRAAFDAGELVRGWPMRGTLFAVAPDDLAGFTRLTAPRLQTALRGRRRTMGVSEEQYETARAVAVAALDEHPLSRSELAARWHDAGLPAGPGFDYHFTSTLAIDGVLALGRFDGRDQLVERARESTEDSAAFLARITRNYFAARGPATLDDLAWWTKLPKSLLRVSVDSVEGLEAVAVDGVPMHYLDDGATTDAPAGVTLLPGFDEWVLGYQSRALIGTAPALAAITTSNGIFRPAVLLDGLVVGSWTARAPASAQVVERLSAAQRAAVEAAVAAWPFG